MPCENSNVKNVCLVTPFIPPAYSGSGIRIYKYAQRLHRKGKLGFIIAFQGSHRITQGAETQWEQKTFDPIPKRKIFLVPYRSGGNHKVIARAFGFATHSIIILGYVLRALVWGRGSLGIIHCFGAGWISLYSVLIAKLIGKKTMIEMTSLGADDPVSIACNTRSKTLTVLRKWLFSKADIIVSISPALSSAYKSAGMPVEKLREVANPVDTRCYRPVEKDEVSKIRKKLGIPIDRTPIILYVGTIMRRKGCDILVEAFLQIVQKYPHAILLLCGPNTIKAEQIELTNWAKLIARNAGVEDQLFFTGQVSNVDEYMKASDLFVFASKREGLPNVILEAMATGLPVIALQIPGIMDYIITDGKDGLIIGEDEADKFSTAVDKLLQDKTLYKQISKQARETAITRFSTQVIDGQYERIYNEMAG